jgi:hypothetical protein
MYRKAIARFSTRTMENLGDFYDAKFSYAFVQESYSTCTMAYYSAKIRYCETTDSITHTIRVRHEDGRLSDKACWECLYEYIMIPPPACGF